jgi:membrane-associated phospholipid phosphatase
MKPVQAEDYPFVAEFLTDSGGQIRKVVLQLEDYQPSKDIANGIASPGLHSFPSGHVVVSVTMYGLIFYLWCRASRSWVERGIAIAFGTVWLGLIAASRLTLGAHWPSDIIAGFILGVLWLITVILALERGQRIVKAMLIKNIG